MNQTFVANKFSHITCISSELCEGVATELTFYITVQT